MHALNFDYSFELSCDIDDDLLFEIQWWDKFEAEIQAPFIVGMEGLWSAIWKFISSIFRKLKSLFSSESAENIEAQTTKSLKTADEIVEYFSKDKIEKLEALSQIKVANDFYVEKMKETLGDKKHISLKSLAYLCENITCYTAFTNEVQSLFSALDNESTTMTLHNYADFKRLRDFEKEQLDMKPLIFDNQKMQFSNDTPFGKRTQGIIDSFLAKFESKKNLLFTNTIDGCNLGNLVSGKLKLISMLPGVHFVNKDNLSEADIPKFIDNLKTIVDKMVLMQGAFDSLLKIQLKIINQTRKNLDFKEMTKDFPEKLVQKLETDHKVLLTSIKTWMLAYSKIISVVIRTGTVTPLMILRLAIREMNLAKKITGALIEKSDEFINSK